MTADERHARSVGEGAWRVGSARRRSRGRFESSIRVLVGSVFLALCGVVPMARANPGYVHVVRPGETLASIAQQYYGDPRRETVLVTENGLTGHGGAAIVVGLRLNVPWVTYHRVAAGETWSNLAARFYGDPRRAFVLIEANGGNQGEQPDLGAELLVPYPVRHIASHGERVERVAQVYFGSTSSDVVRRLRRFNALRGPRLNRGQIVLVPLADLTLSLDGQRIVEQLTGRRIHSGEVRERQAIIEQRLPELRNQVQGGRYTEAVALGNQLLGAGELTGNQVVTIQRELGIAFVALRELDLAQRAFTAALERQPDLELDALRTSPLVLRLFEATKTRVRASGAKHREAARSTTPAVPARNGAPN